MAPYTSWPFQGFGGGLNLRDKADAVSPSECIDCLDVTFTDRGAIQERDGWASFAGPLTNTVDSLEAFYTASGTRQLLAGAGTRLEALSTGGEVIASATGLTGGPWDFARFGQPNAEVAYAGNGSDTLRKWNGTEWSAPTATVDGEGVKAMPKARFLCVQSPDNRLFATGYSGTTGGPNAATSSPAHVYVSEAGNPEAWKTNNNLQLTPGDGEKIQGAIAWREFVFVFKETKFFVFYGNSTDAEGEPIFNYRPVDTGVGLASPRALCADATGVYFMSRHGLYRTTGQEPEEVSQIVTPIWSGDASPFYKGGTLAQGSITNCVMDTFEERVYLAFPTESTNNRTLVFDPQLGWFSLYSLPCRALTSFRIGEREELVFGYNLGSNRIGRHSRTYLSDGGSAIPSDWRSGWFDLESPDVKTLRSSKVWGSGEPRMGIDFDFNVNATPTDELDLSGSTGSVLGGEGYLGGPGYLGDLTSALVTKERRRAVRGTVFSVHFTGNNQAGVKWSMHRVDLHQREIRRPAALNA